MDRKISIEIRNEETDVLKILTIYAKKQGSKNPEMLYMVYTKLVYKILNIESRMRGQFNSSQLSIIATLEIMIAQTVIDLMKQNKHYKDIYKQVKSKLLSFQKLIKTEELYSSKNKEYNIKLAS